MKLLIIVGARPNFIKVAPLLEEIKRHRSLSYVLVHTGQHYEFLMSQVFFEALGVPKPTYNLRVGSQSHAWQTAEIMKRVEPVMEKEKPDMVVVLGDVNSTIAAALVAAKLRIPVAHVEAGLRSYDRAMPEEINRVLTDHVSDLLFCPTGTAVKNLKKEGITRGVFNTGDIMYDAFLKNSALAKKKSGIGKKLSLEPKHFVLLTIHRPGNVDNAEYLKEIFEIIGGSGKRIVAPLHPRTQKVFGRFAKKILARYPNIICTDPVDYFDMLWLEANADKILTDSGGVQKEAYFARTPCIVLRDTTEWVELVKAGWAVLAGRDEKKITRAMKSFARPSTRVELLGNGKAAARMADCIEEFAARLASIS